MELEDLSKKGLINLIRDYDQDIAKECVGEVSSAYFTTIEGYLNLEPQTKYEKVKVVEFANIYDMQLELEKLRNFRQNIFENVALNIYHEGGKEILENMTKMAQDFYEANRS